MTAAELIAALQAFPPNVKVLIALELGLHVPTPHLFPPGAIDREDAAELAAEGVGAGDPYILL